MTAPIDSASSARYLPADWTFPLLNEQNRPFFTAGKLTLQRCDNCGQVQHPPLDVCRRCQAQQFGYTVASGAGRISSHTVVHKAVDSRLDRFVPYNVVIVELDDYPGVMVVGNVINADDADLGIDQPVRCTFAEVRDPDTGELLRLPQWNLVGPDEGED